MPEISSRLQKFLHIICSFWLASLLLFGAAPKEILHEFARHHDTVHKHDVDGPVMDAGHHHCSFVGFELMPFAAPPTIPFGLRVSLPQYVSFFLVQDTRALQQLVALREGRGPPVGV